MDMRNDKRRYALSFNSHARVNFSQSETSSLLRGRVKFWAPIVGGLREKIPEIKKTDSFHFYLLIPLHTTTSLSVLPFYSFPSSGNPAEDLPSKWKKNEFALTRPNASHSLPTSCRVVSSLQFRFARFETAKQISYSSRSCMQILKDFQCCIDFFCKILENPSRILHALQIDCSMEIFRKFLDALCKKSMIFPCNIQNFASFSYQFLHNFTFKKSIENLFWYFYPIFHATWKIFHACHSVLNEIRNWVVVIVYSFHGLLSIMIAINFHLR